MEFSNEALAEKNFKTMVAYYESRGIKSFESSRIDGSPVFFMNFTYTGKDFPMNFTFVVDGEKGIVRMISRQPITVEAEKMQEMVLVLNAINTIVINGKYVLDYNKGAVNFDVALPYMDAEITESQLDYLLLLSIHIVDDYNDLLIMFNKGLVDVQTVLNKVMSGE